IVFKNHMDRLKKSAAFFNFHVDHQVIQKELSSIATQHSKGDYLVRLLVKKDGTFTAEISDRQENNVTTYISLTESTICKDNPFLYHKTTNRSMYQQFRKQHTNVYDVLLWNEAHELTEFTNGNIVVELDGVLITPPVDCGLLPGTFRRKLIEEGLIMERN